MEIFIVGEFMNNTRFCVQEKIQCDDLSGTSKQISYCVDNKQTCIDDNKHLLLCIDNNKDLLLCIDNNKDVLFSAVNTKVKLNTKNNTAFRDINSHYFSQVN